MDLLLVKNFKLCYKRYITFVIIVCCTSTYVLPIYRKLSIYKGFKGCKNVIKFMYVGNQFLLCFFIRE